MKKIMYKLNAILALGTIITLSNTAQATESDDLSVSKSLSRHTVVTDVASILKPDAYKASDADLEMRAKGYLKQLQERYPFDAKKDLGQDFEMHLKGTGPWDNYLTSAVRNELAVLKGEVTKEEVHMADVDFRSVLRGMAGSIGSVWPDYKKDPLLRLKMTIEAACQNYAPAIHNLGRGYKEGIGGLLHDEEKGQILMNFALLVSDPSVEELKETLKWEAGEYGQ